MIFYSEWRSPYNEKIYRRLDDLDPRASIYWKSQQQFCVRVIPLDDAYIEWTLDQITKMVEGR